MAFTLLGRSVASPVDLSSRSPQLILRPSSGRRAGTCATVPASPLVARADSPSAAACGLLTRPPAGPSTILCSSLRKERKKLAKVLKSHRKVLERRLSALTAAEIDAPVLSELLSELRTLTSRLEDQRAASLMYASESSDSSDSDDECPARPAARVAAMHRSSQACVAGAGAAQRQPESAASVAPAASPAVQHGPGSTLVVSGLSGQVELAVPEIDEGWQWSEDEFRAAKFEGTGGRIMVCTGSKCQRKGATEVLRAVSALSEGNPAIDVVPCKCVGKCSAGAAIRVRPQGQACATYTQVRPAQLRELFSGTLPG
ncbi:hypothetical protein GPECTOR_4g570 [Gonium pectorale]|uniref:Uncharacterized protein n=1 Tax=Gonium pectorale TaxID=33097 RepID=A0A150GXH1_GONPE|nr:hypothetical protein GPECTOR_4g570 [Gonium pectorale]|eukprot:KXZ54505.1 hypothetical protein GPECTOR_4g570 [Gonium pectorale]